MAAIAISNKVGFIDKTGQIIISPQYDDVGSFQNGKVQVMLDGNVFYIDKSGNKVTQ